MAERKLYLASILAVDMRNGIPNTRHFPIILDAERIDDTRKEACDMANLLCPPTQFPLRHIVVRQIPLENITANLLPIAQSLAGSASTTDKTIEFECRGQSFNREDFVILELEKPAA